MKQLASWLKANLPLLAVMLIGIIIAIANIQLQSTYTGWDNLNGELDLWRYTKQVWGGAWLEHQGTGAPMNLAHLAEIPRLPILWLLNAILPTNLVRISFIFLMYLAGGISMYYYLFKVWLNETVTWQKKWLAALGSMLYLLHIITLQQFYIAFEMFVVQFAFLPLLLLTLHRFAKPLTAKTLLIFLGVQLLLAPSAHTPTNFYLATLFSQIYVLFLMLPKGWAKAVWTAILVGLLTLAANFYWIVPNVYYTLQDSQYVQQSHDNQVFATESISSIREAGSVSNFLQNKQYLFDWKDYFFQDEKHVFIFDEWQPHLDQPFVIIILSSITLLTLAGVVITIRDKQKGTKRWAIILIYLASLSFIWMGFLPTGWFFDLLYRFSGTFTEMFRNPFTKLSIIYSVVSILLFVSSIEFLMSKLGKLQKNRLSSGLKIGLIALTSGAIIYSAWPSFQGHFISDKLETQIPDQYQQMFAYLKTQDSNLRVLPLPQTNHAGWEYYEWQFLGTNNGYQGMGFYFFGVSQPVLHRDSDRWVESSDFFYHELKFALDSQDINLFESVIQKYDVDLILIDETRIEPNQTIDFAAQHQFAVQAGFEQVWHQDFLTLYQKVDSFNSEEVFAPTEFTEISAPAERTVIDAAYTEYGNYIQSDTANITFPFENLNKKEVTNLQYTDDSVSYTQSLEIGDNGQLILEIPGFQNSAMPVTITRQKNVINFDFPRTELKIGDQTVVMSSIPDQSLTIDGHNDQEVMIVINDRAILLKNDVSLLRTIELQPSKTNILVNIVTNPDGIPKTASGEIDGTRLSVSELGYITVPTSFWTTQQIPLVTANQATVTTYFPVLKIDPMEEDSHNCSEPIRGEISTRQNLISADITYTANDYAVNCSGISLNNIGTNADYVLHLTGGNKSGRGLKFFVNRSDAQMDDIVFAENNFDTSLSLHSLSHADLSSTILTWEVRSHGQAVESQLQKMEVAVLPLTQIANSKIIRLNDEVGPISNSLKILEDHSIQSIYTVKTSCRTANCLLTLDQSYDRAWIALVKPMSFSWHQLSLAKHYRYNGWANAWTLPDCELHIQSSDDCMYNVYIFYWPQLVSWISFVIFLSGGGALIYFFYAKQQRTSQFNQSYWQKQNSRLASQIKSLLNPQSQRPLI